MKLLSLLLASASASLVWARVSEWAFEDGSVSVVKTAAGGRSRDPVFSAKISSNTHLDTPVKLGPDSKLVVNLTPTVAGDPKRPHQAFLSLTAESQNGGAALQELFPLAVKPSAKSNVEIGYQLIPTHFLQLGRGAQIDVSVVIASFGPSVPYKKSVFSIVLGGAGKSDKEGDGAAEEDAAAGSPTPSATGVPPVRYRALPEIHHIFRAEPRSPPKIVSLFFTAAVLSILPAFLAFWIFQMGANVDQLSIAARDAPIPHAVFALSIIGIEGVLGLYYTTWKLFQLLPALVLLGGVAVVSGSRALSEVQARRLKGLR